LNRKLKLHIEDSKNRSIRARTSSNTKHYHFSSNKKIIYNSDTLFNIFFWIYCLSDEIHASVICSRI